ncbi:MAG: Ig-like domain-containing protein [Treponema sp.]|nr:Ig-like domain-containing protein [Candidatus Treponema equifaecale]
MKKVLKAFAVIASIAMLGFGFMSCSGDDDEDEDPPAKITMNGKAYDTIKTAIAEMGSTGEYKIVLQPGTYNEDFIHYNGGATLTISGNTKAKYGADVIITGHGENMGKEKGRELVEVEGSGNLVLENLTLLSDYSRENVTGDAQAEVLGFDSTGTVAAYNCSFKSHQDTMRTTGKGWFYKCLVEGDTDFIWMESAGQVALYEECEIVSVYDKFASTHAGYVLAPRVNVGNVIGKGAVIFNSKVKFENDSNFLFRNPWGTNKDYYNNGAFVGCTFEVAEGKTLEPALAKSAAMGTSDQQLIGWKLDKALSDAYTSKMDSIGTISDELKAKEYSGRRAILNRNYNIKNEAFAKDVATNWAIDDFIKAKGWTVTADTSKEVAEGETENVAKVYDLTTADVPAGITATGFANETGKTHFAGQKDATMTFDVTGKCTVSVTGYYAGSGKIAAGSQGEAYYDFNNGSTSKFVTKDYIVYTEGTSTVTITATATSYITKIVVTYDNAIKNTPVSSITVTAADNMTEIAGKKTLQFSGAVVPSNASNTDFDWSVSDAEAATIDAKGLLTAADVQEEKTITVTATAKDPSSVNGTYTLKIIPASANAVDLTWLAGTDSSFVGATSNAEIATPSDCVPSLTGDGITWAYNESKNGGTCDSGVTLTATDDDPTKGEWYIEYPINNVCQDLDLKIDTAKVAFGNAGTDNFRAYVTFVDSEGTESVVFDDDNSDKAATCNPRKLTYEFKIGKIVPAGKTGKVRVSIHGYQNGAFKQALTGKSPTWGKTVISCEAGKFPIAGQTYSYDFCSAEMAGKTSSEDGFVTWGTAASTNHGIASGTLDFQVAGNVKISLGLCQYGNNTTYVIRKGEETLASFAVGVNNVDKATACYSKGVTPSFTDANSRTFNYEGEAAVLTISGIKYLEGLKIEPAN